MSLTLSAQPGFTEIPDATWNTGSSLSSSALKSMNADTKFAAVRNEQFWGYYRNGETVALPTSPADGYNYSQAELVYSWSLYSSAPSLVALNGTHSAPVPAANSGPGTLLGVQYNVNQATGLVGCIASYFNGTQTNTTDGIIMVIVHAQRSR
jgi:hypothetical protein